ncbi:uncharacterized protein N7515_006860 [Penicillium bovifimosum]|uniref:DNA helicase Pif1-like 2B domain-containing protein n=1 Tax=Penicillium bovifimosum TaxID=126998 RepID=A0A9W9L160_9EURO|nr:uncharacterized protein N7515_006860 [Penicillium bovifimosum]KAJ5130821.1 hypothetical protein N7515_006860 [Penicillium bovifimosum]
MSSDTRVMYSADSAHIRHDISPDFRRDFPNLPPHRLTLKVGVPITLLCNVDVEHGLCNGTRCMVVEVENELENVDDHVMVRPVNASREQRAWPIRRCNFGYEVPGYSRMMTREQFPMRVSFAMTVYKAQGMSWKPRQGLRPSLCTIIVQEAKVKGEMEKNTAIIEATEGIYTFPQWNGQREALQPLVFCP